MLRERASHEDRIWEMYHSDIYQPDTRRACRARIHWLAERAEGRVLDVGCSQGLLPILLAREGYEVVSVPVNHRERTRGKSKYGLHNRLWVGIVDLFGLAWLRRRASPRVPVTEER